MIKLIPAKGNPCTPNDTNYLTDNDGNRVPGATLYIGVTGDVVALPAENDDTNSTTTTGTNGAILYKSVPVGPFPYSVKKVFSTGTTATNIIYHFD